MADTPAPGGFLARLAAAFTWGPGAKAAPSAATAVQAKAELTPTYLGPRYVGTFRPDFIPLDGHGHTLDILGETGLALVAYWYVAQRWRAQKLAEAPLMVVEEDQDTGTEEWLSEHELAEVLEEPSPDYDMGELIERTSRYLDNGAACLWVVDRDRAGRPARLTPFSREEFEVVPIPGRLYGRFAVTTAAGRKEYDAEEVVYFRDAAAGWTEHGKSRLDVCAGWLGLSEKARRTIHELLDNAVWPSLVLNTDPTWNPGEEELKRFQAELAQYAQNKGRAFANTGGGSAEILSARIRDLVPTEVLDRVESVVGAVSGVPAIVLQFQVGMENSPWSQMEQARTMAYADTIQPAWGRLERAITRQLLRIDDEDRTHLVRFDRSGIASLQQDRQEAAQFTAFVSRIASVNERRVIVGLEPVDDPAAELIPELQPVVLPPGLGGSSEEEEPEEKAQRRRRQKKVAAMTIAFRRESSAALEATTSQLLRTDAQEVEQLLRANLTEEPKGLRGTMGTKAERGKQRALSAVLGYLRNTSEPAWGKATNPQLLVSAERATAVIAADIGISYNLLHPHVVTFAKRESGRLVKGVSETTMQWIGDTVARELEAGKSVADIARAVGESGAFAPSRARLIARTESTRASAGGPTEALAKHAAETGRKYVKRWSGALDDRERDEHVKLEGETVKIDEAFSNGLQFPSEPNCRCAPIFEEVDA